MGDVGTLGELGPAHVRSLLIDRLMTIILAAACVCVTCCSSMAGSTYAGMRETFGVGEEVCILSISLFVAGLGVGPCELATFSLR